MRGVTAGINIGSTEITSVITKCEKEGKIRILGVGSVPSAGVRRGSIIDPEEAARPIRCSFDEALRTSRVSLRSAVVGIGGVHLGSYATRGVVAVSRADGEITEDDVRRVVHAAEGFAQKSPNREVIHLIPREFKIDGQGGITDPVGMVGMKLEVDCLVVDGAKQSLQNVVKSCELAGIEIEDWAVNVLAASEVLLTKAQRELGVMLLDLGGGTSDYAVFEEGRVLDVGSFPIGGSHITSDIAIGFRTPVSVAEAVKVRHAHVLLGDRNSKRETISLADFPGGDTSTFALRDLADIVAARLTDVFELSTKALRKTGRAGLLPGGIVLTGGVAEIPGIQDLARRELKLPVEVARAIASDTFADVIPARLAIPVGLTLWQEQQYAIGFGEYRENFTKVFSRLRKFFQSLVP